jgi:hypothetical protein
VPNLIESPESSSPIVTRAVAAGLRGEYCENYEFPNWQKVALNGLGALPQAVSRFVISRFESISGLDPKVLENFSITELVRARLKDYEGCTGPFPAIVIGAALGGAAAYLSTAMGAPFLPQAFVVSLKHGSFTGDVNEYLNRSLNRALRIAADNPGIMTIQHYDPIHDGWMTRYINHLRFKLIDLPLEYANFIHSNLKPGGVVLYLDSAASWLRYRVGPRSVFQVGGWGGIPAEEFLEGSERIRAYGRSTGFKFHNWKLKDYEVESGPESEWGSEPGLAEAIEAFCRAQGFRFVRIHRPYPNDFPRIAFESARFLLKKEGRPPAGVVVEMFTQFDVNAVRQAGLLPLWLIFNTPDSLEFLKEMRPKFPIDKPIFFSPLATFSMTPDLVPWKDWEKALEGLKWNNIGTRPNHYPADARALVKWAEPLRQWVALNRHPIKSVLETDELLEIIKDQLP